MKYRVDMLRGFPQLALTAENKKDREQLTKLHGDMEKAQMEAIKSDGAGRFNVCGSMSSGDEVEDIAVGLVLGGPAFAIVWPPDPDRDILLYQMSRYAEFLKRWHNEAAKRLGGE